MEREKGFEPSTPTLARLCSTPELLPLEDSIIMGIICEKFSTLQEKRFFYKVADVEKKPSFSGEGMSVTTL